MTTRNLLITACLIAIGTSSLIIAQDAAPTKAEADQAAREETVRRQEAQLLARQLIDKGLKLYYDGQHEQAIEPLAEGLRILPRARATELDYNRGAQALTECYYRVADAAYRSGNSAKARELAVKALEYDPKNRSAENLIVKIRQSEIQAKERAERVAANPEITEPALDNTPEFNAKKEQIKKLFREGKILLNSGQFDAAEARFQQVLLIDNYNEDAHILLGELNRRRLGIAKTATDQTRTKALWEVQQAWVQPVSRDVKLPAAVTGQGSITAVPSEIARIQEKLNTIKIPEINFREAAITDVVTFLSDESRKLDPEGKGVNIVLGQGVLDSTGGAAPAPAPVPGGEGLPPMPLPSGAADGKRVTVSLRDIPLVEALKYVTSLVNLKYRIDSNAVLILPIDAPTGDMITRSYPVNPGAIETVLAQPGESGGPAGIGTDRGIGSGATLTSVPTQVKTYFEESGVKFPAGATLTYNPRTSKIIIHNTAENLETFEKILADLNIVPFQVEIESKFVDIGQADLEELGFKWFVGQYSHGKYDVEGGSPSQAFPPGSGPSESNYDEITTGLRDSGIIQSSAVNALLGAATGGALAPGQLATFRGVLTNPQFAVVITALSQKGSTDLLSAPKITTISGAQAQIKIVTEFIYPTEFQAPQVVAAGGGDNGGGSVATTPSIPGGFKTREIGVLLNVTPQVGPDGYTINLTLIPEVSEFLGFINYGGPISVGTGDNIVTTQNDIKQPLFSTRTLTTSIMIWDGQTVVLGGLIKEDISKIDDKVPFLGDIPIVGRLFRSKSTTRSKRNLLIFVTARLIDPAGNPIHRENLSL